MSALKSACAFCRVADIYRISGTRRTTATKGMNADDGDLVAAWPPPE
jgi:hypothetical protein